MDPRASVNEAVMEAQLDEAEGADLLMVKPALAYLDVVAAVRAATRRPLAVYNVSGEYAMVHAQHPDVDERKGVVEEIMHAFHRAGASVIVTYHAGKLSNKDGWGCRHDRDVSTALHAEASQHLVGGVNSPVRAFKSVHGEPIYIKDAKGATVTDADGNTLVDFVQSWGR